MFLRAFHPALQWAIWTRDFDTPLWRDYSNALLRSMHPEAVDSRTARACVYAAVDTKSRFWYVGKTKPVRGERNNPFPGWVLRFREHALTAFVAERARKAPEPRYKAWRQSRPGRLLCVPVLFCDDRASTVIESALIAGSRPPTQVKAYGKGKTGKPGARTRPWPQYRRPTEVTTEVDRNQVQKLLLGYTPKLAQDLWMPWDDWSSWRTSQTGLPEAALRKKMFDPGFLADMVVWCGENQNAWSGKLCGTRDMGPKPHEPLGSRFTDSPKTAHDEQRKNRTVPAGS